MSLFDRVSWIVLMVGVIGQISLMRAIARRIKQVSLTTWASLGKPEMRFLSLGNLERAADNWYSTRALQTYVYFKGSHRKLTDATLTRMIWAARFLTVALLSGWAVILWMLLRGY